MLKLPCLHDSCKDCLLTNTKNNFACNELKCSCGNNIPDSFIKTILDDEKEFEHLIEERCS